jgi:hypothetical protein
MGDFHMHIFPEQALQAGCGSCLRRPTIDAASARDHVLAVECTEGAHCEFRKQSEAVEAAWLKLLGFSK